MIITTPIEVLSDMQEMLEKINSTALSKVGYIQRVEPNPPHDFISELYREVATVSAILARLVADTVTEPPPSRPNYFHHA